jgi:hypothetical protein
MPPGGQAIRPALRGGFFFRQFLLYPAPLGCPP